MAEQKKAVNRCSEQVLPDGSWHRRQCSRTAYVQREVKRVESAPIMAPVPEGWDGLLDSRAGREAFRTGEWTHTEHVDLKWFCPQHDPVAQQKKYEDKRAAENRARDQRDKHLNECQQRAKLFREVFGGESYDVEAEYRRDHDFRATGNLTVSWKLALKAMTEVKALRAEVAKLKGEEAQG